MSKTKEKSRLEELPLDIKIDILRRLGSIYDLEALGLTCRVFYNICKSPQCNATVYRQLLLNGEYGDLLRGLAVLRAYGRDDKLKLLQDACHFPEGNPTDNTEYFYKLLSYQKTIRWFTNRFFEAMAEKYGAVPTNSNESDGSIISKRFIPSGSESQRLDNAFLVFWILAEAVYLFENRKADGTIDGGHLDEQLFGNGDRNMFVYTMLWQVLGSLDGLQLRLSLDFSVMYSVAQFLSELTTPMALRYADTRSHEEVSAISTKLGCPDVYNRRGISNLLLWNLGLNGLRSFLGEDEGAQTSTIGKYYNRPLEPKLDVDDEEPFKFFISCFFSLIDGVWIYMKDHPRNVETIHLRPLWRESGIIHLLSIPPWNQADEFDIDAVFCDDERLERLGYFRPGISVNGEETDRNSLEEKMKDEVCHCKEDWGCWD
ncbi:uncharacterized protein DFL_002261 [Arthrobotrys flagrans]|uniref:F-box domain-containing protein n=1 Tax=Arthrobotrys flagrans TaxID=97331 RepID=A0A437A9Y9_ARTFL|nr:hypothetical protein DFL_002261 [Arthrobotrys flagrans]